MNFKWVRIRPRPSTNEALKTNDLMTYQPKTVSAVTGPGRGSPPGLKGKFQAITGGELHGRGGEALSHHDPAIIGHQPGWPRGRIIEIQYEPAPGCPSSNEGWVPCAIKVKPRED
jgi:hypothetical protein